jgi:acetoin utilization deacetylase AcuC-like enzyme
MSTLTLVRDDEFQEHLTPELHPEAPNRLQAIDKAFLTSSLDDSVRQLAPRPASEDDITTVHNAAYIEELEKDSRIAKDQDRIVQIDADTFMSPRTFDLAKLAVGAGMVGVDSVLDTEAKSCFVSVRPPGHHALADKAMGFCFFNNVAVAARYAQKKAGMKRILIIDWDVHHGNGTQDIFYNDPSVCFISFHQFPFWPPDSGWYTEDGAGDGKGYNINIPMPAGTGDRGYLEAWKRIVEPVAMAYKPEMILLSAGYDAHQDDPLGQQRISTKGFAELSQRLLNLAHENDAKLVSFLEGGYNVKSLSESAVATMKVLNEDKNGTLVPDVVLHSKSIIASTHGGILPDRNASLVDERITEVRKHFQRFWPALKGD